MNNILLGFLIVVFLFFSCTQKKDKLRENESTMVALLETDSLCLKKKNLVETVLNYPDVIRYSRLKNVRKAFDTIFIIFDEGDVNCILPPYIQQGDTLKVTYKNDSINTIEKPFYELKKMDITGDSAYIYLEFDISGALAYGSLKRINKQWVPDSNFVTGVR